MDKVIEKVKLFSNPNYKSASLKTASILYEYMNPQKRIKKLWQCIKLK